MDSDEEEQPYYRTLDENDLSLRKETEIILKQIKKINDNKDEYFKFWREDNPKDDKTAEKICNLGNNYYEMNFNCKELLALKTFTQSIAFAIPDSKQLGTAVWCRSTVLFNLKKYEECIKDCEFGLSVRQSPAPLKADFLIRKIECYVALKDPKLVAEASKALKSLKKMKFCQDVKSRYTSQLKKTIADAPVILKAAKETQSSAIRKEEQMSNKFSDEQLKLKIERYSPQAKMPSVSNKVELCIDPDGSTYVRATADITVGEFLAFEKPFNSNRTQNFKYYFCDNCCNSFWNLWPCNKCIDVVYCSKECQDEHWRMCHQYECNVYPIAWGSSTYNALDDDKVLDKTEGCFLWHVKLAIIAVQKAGGIEKMRKEIEEVQKLKNVRGKQKQYIHKMYSHNSPVSILGYNINLNRDLHELLMAKKAPSYACQAVYYLATRTDLFLKKYSQKTSLSDIMKNKNVLFMAALILRIGVTISFSNLHIDTAYMSHCPDNILSQKNHKYGYSVYPFSHNIKHHCDPNVECMTSIENDLMVYAVKPIRQGSELLISYSGTEFYFFDKKIRQHLLKRYKNFICRCMACEEEWPVLENTDTVTDEFKDLPFEVTEEINNYINLLKGYNWKCKHCVKYDPILLKLLVEFLSLLGSYDLFAFIEYHESLTNLRALYISTLGKKFLQLSNVCEPPNTRGSRFDDPTPQQIPYS